MSVNLLYLCHYRSSHRPLEVITYDNYDFYLLIQYYVVMMTNAFSIYSTIQVNLATQVTYLLINIGIRYIRPFDQFFILMKSLVSRSRHDSLPMTGLRL